MREAQGEIRDHLYREEDQKKILVETNKYYETKSFTERHVILVTEKTFQLESCEIVTVKIDA